MSARAKNQNKSGGRAKARPNACTCPWTVNYTTSRSRRSRGLSRTLVWLIGPTAKDTPLPTQLLKPHPVDFGAQIAHLPFELPYLMLPRLASRPHLFLKLLNNHVWIILGDMLLVERRFCGERARDRASTGSSTGAIRSRGRGRIERRDVIGEVCTKYGGDGTQAKSGERRRRWWSTGWTQPAVQVDT